MGMEKVKWREGMFHDERSFQKYRLVLALHCSSAAFRRRREERERWFFEWHRLDLERSDGGFPILANLHEMDNIILR